MLILYPNNNDHVNKIDLTPFNVNKIDLTPFIDPIHMTPFMRLLGCLQRMKVLFTRSDIKKYGTQMKQATEEARIDTFAS